MKLLMTGDSSYNNRLRIRKIVQHNIKNTIIATFGRQNGADSLILLLCLRVLKNTYYFKMYSLSYDYKCLQQKWKFNRAFHPALYDSRNTEALN